MYFIPENEPNKMIKIRGLNVVPQGLNTSTPRQGNEISSIPTTSMIESLQSSTTHIKYQTSVQINSTPVASSSKVQGFKSVVATT